MVEASNSQTKFRKGNPLVQQRLRAWQPFLSPKWVLLMFGSIGVVFLAVGIAITVVNSKLVELSEEYVGEPVASGGTMTSTMVDVIIPITEDMQAPVYVYYELTNFYQNHRRYVESRSNTQMQSSQPSLSGYSSCSPMEKDTYGNMYYPCGLVATSVFNDTMSFFVRDSQGTDTKLNVDTDASTISWDSDVTHKYNYVSPDSQSPQSYIYSDAMNMWINTMFPPQRCVPADLSSGSNTPVYVRTVPVTTNQNTNLNNPNVEMFRKADCDYTAKTCNFTDNLVTNAVFACAGSYEVKSETTYGIQSGQFINWMRTASLPTFRKLYGKINQNLSKGDSVIVRVQAGFPVASFGGTKKIVLATTSLLGGKSYFLGVAYLTVGALSLFFAAVFAYKHFKSPKFIDDIRYLD